MSFHLYLPKNASKETNKRMIHKSSRGGHVVRTTKYDSGLVVHFTLSGVGVLLTLFLF